MRAKQRDFFAAESIGISAAVPMFVQAVNGLRHRFRKSDFARDRSASFAADLHQRARFGLLLRGDAHQSLHALQERRSGGHVRNSVVQTLPADAGPVCQLHVSLGPDLVRAQDMKQFGGIAAASGVFQQQGVIKVALFCVTSDRFRRLVACRSCKTVPNVPWAALRKVESIRKRGDDLGDSNGMPGPLRKGQNSFGEAGEREWLSAKA